VSSRIICRVVRKRSVTCISGRRNQYDLWPGYAQVAKPGDNLVLVLDETPDVHGTVKALSPFFTTATRGVLASAVARSGHRERASSVDPVRLPWGLAPAVVGRSGLSRCG
jgi:hypothetical protein